MTTIAFIGLGNMGGGMAANLAKAGHDVAAFDISEDALATPKPTGAGLPHQAPTPSKAPKPSLRCCLQESMSALFLLMMCSTMPSQALCFSIVRQLMSEPRAMSPNRPQAKAC